jgi:hypothetical protein
MTVAADISSSRRLKKNFPVISVLQVKTFQRFSPNPFELQRGGEPQQQNNPLHQIKHTSFGCWFCRSSSISLVPSLAIPRREIHESPTFYPLKRKDRLSKSVPSSHERPTNDSRKAFIASATSQHSSTLCPHKSCHQVCESGSCSGTQVELCSGMTHSWLCYFCYFCHMTDSQ